MPKIRSHQGTKARVRITRTGKVLARKSHGNHNLEKKGPGRKRALGRPYPIEGKIRKGIRRNLGV